jgi:SAM-dependent methyltransferase
MTEQKFDDAKADAFGGRLIGILNSGGLAIMISIGHRTGLFDAMAGLEPSTSQQIADTAKLNERYVREWLGAMFTGKIVEFESESKTYNLPAEHAARLTRGSVPNGATSMQWVPLLGTVQDQIIECFVNGGGVPYSAFGRVQEVFAETSEQRVIPAIVDRILAQYDGLIERLEEGIDVLDVGCGSGRALIVMSAKFPNSRFLGVDIAAEGIRTANEESSAKGLTNIRFEVKDGADLGFYNQFDLITTFDAIHDQAAPDKALAQIFSALRKDGVYMMLDIKASSELQNNADHIMAPLLYTISTMHCMTVSLAEGGLGLGTLWGRELAVKMLGEAGFAQTDVREIDGNILNELFFSTR